MQLPNGYIVQTANPDDSFFVYGELNENGFIAKGYRIGVPYLGNAGNALLNDLFVRLAGWLASQTLDKRIQIRYTRDADYHDILDSYREQTEQNVQDVWTRHTRETICNGCKADLEARRLRREYVYVFFARKIKPFMKSGFLPESYADRVRFEKEVATAFDSDLTDLRQFLNLPISPLDHIGLYREYYRGLNKSALELNIDYEQTFHPDLAEAVACDFAGHFADDPGCASFRSDGYFHNIFVLHDFPQSDLVPFYGNRMLANEIQNLTIVVNLEHLNTEKVIEQKQKHWKRVRADLLEEESEVAATAGLDELTEHIYRLGKGEDSPFRVEYVIHTWNRSLEQLQSDSIILKQAATAMFTSLDGFELGLQAMHNFLKTLPGYLYYKRQDAALDCMHRPLAAMLPFASSFVGKGKDGNILFHGDHGNLMTFNFFENGTPQHTLCLGQTGSGKSVNFAAILSQSYYDFEKIVIIEEGGSYFNLTQIYGDEAQYIVIDPSANLTLNYFDTGGLPLTPGQIEFATTFLTAMAGESVDLEKIQDRAAIIAPYVAAVYTDAFQEWRRRHRSKLEKAARVALTVEHMMPTMPLDRNTLLDAFFELREQLESDKESEIVKFYHGLTTQQINNMIIDDPELLRNIAYAYMDKADMPYHSQLVEALRENTVSDSSREESRKIAARLAVYSVESGTGCLFDGETTIDLTKKWIHIELGKMAQSSNALKNLVGIAINNLVRNQIICMPRSVRKLYLYEEAARFLMIPGAAEIMKQSYAQFRKFSCVAVTITQSIAQMAQCDVGRIIMTQSKLFLFLKNTDAAELAEITNYLPLSEEARRNIMNFPAPEHLPPGRRFSSFLLFAQRADWPLVGVGRNYAGPAILAAAATSGTLHSRLIRILKHIQQRHPEKTFAVQLLEATELLNEDNKLFLLLDKLERMFGERASPLIVEAKLEFHNLIKQQTN